MRYSVLHFRIHFESCKRLHVMQAPAHAPDIAAQLLHALTRNCHMRSHATAMHPCSLFRASATVLGVPVEDALEAYGVSFIDYVRSQVRVPQGRQTSG